MEGAVKRILDLAARALFASLLLTGLAVPAIAQALPNANCATRQPVTIRVGVPTRLPATDGHEAIRHAAERAVAPLVRAAHRDDGICSGQTRYEVILSIGSDYEVLDWLSQGEVDAGLVTSLGFWLLRRDGVEMIDFTQLSGSTPLNEGARVAAVERTAMTEPTRSKRPTELLTRYREQLLCRALWSLQDHGSTLPEPLLGTCQQQRPPPSPQPPIDTPCHRDAGLVPRYRPIAANHLSELGFVFPLLSNRLWLAERLATLPAESLTEETRQTLERPFEQAFACDLRLSLDHEPFDRIDRTLGPLTLSAQAPDDSSEERPTTEILFSGGPPTLTKSEHLSPHPGVPGHDHWVLLKTRAEIVLGASERLATVLDHGDLAQVPEVIRQYENLFRVPPTTASDESRANGSTDSLPRLLTSLLSSDRGFGTRTMAFTTDEVVRLLRAQQNHTARESQLALVLPGGGVKSTYQSVLLDKLYGSGQLRNAFAASRGSEDDNTRPLSVHQVIGTSGGALIGYFVAQLDQPGPIALTRLLWEKRASDAPQDAPTRLLRSKDIFGPTDILRYLSLIVSSAILGIPLVILALRTPRRQTRRLALEAPRPPRRGWLYGTLGMLLVATPLLVSFISAGRFREQVPEIEGLLFMMLLFLVMTADQCLIREPAAQTPGHSNPNGAGVARLAFAIGAAMIALPMAGRLLLAASWPDLYIVFIGDQASVALCFVVLSLPTVFGVVALPIRALHAPLWAAQGGAWRAFLDYLICSLLALSVVLLPDLTLGTASVPIFFWGLAAPVLLWLLFGNLRRGRKRFGKLRWRATYYGGLTVASAVILALCLPARPDLSHPLRTLNAASRLGTFAGSLLVTAGAVTLGYGILLWLYRSDRGYVFRDLGRFASGLLVVIGHAGVVQAGLWILEWLMPNRVPTLELDVRFWQWLFGLAMLGGLLLMVVEQFVWHRLRHRDPMGGRRAPGDDQSWLRRKLRGVCKIAAEGVAFLIEPHPSRPLLSVRFLRLGALAIFSVLWWNVLLAPALYGNRLARETLEGAVRSFEHAMSSSGGATADRHAAPDALPRFTANFVSPANELATDGTRFFLFRPAASQAPAVPEHSRSGSRWLCYRMAQSDNLGDAANPCPRTPTRELLLEVIFASGSPFPIFAPHRVGASIDGRDEMVLIDGGYSNVVPVEAALTLGGDQVLVLRSSNPSPNVDESALGLFIEQWLSPLVKNLGRLPAFVFERSQRVDRLSGQDLFVVSLAPLPEHRDWPALYHFQASVIERLKRIAESDLGERIGFVESWGRPVPQLSLPLTVASPRSTKPRDP